MKQIVQDLKTGDTKILDVPDIYCKPGCNLISSKISLISVGTERMLVDFGKAGFVEKARQQPDKVRMVLDKIRTDGLFPTMDAVRAKLDQPMLMGYCNVGTVIESAGDRFKSGERVISNGHHATTVCVPHNLCAKIPDKVSDEAASFTVIGAIALQGLRLAGPELGETFVVTGLGLVGLMAVQLLLAHGCRVLGVDIDSTKCDLARKFGAEVVDLSKGEDPVAVALDFSRGRGVDGVLITASTKSNEPVHQAALMCRKRGRIILVGVVGLALSRTDFYKKEISFQVSCSYGPGRYDPDYEENGHDYPVGYVRWTEQRNFEAVLDMMAEGKIDVGTLISHRFPFVQAEDAYKVLTDDRAALGIVLQYESRSGLQEDRTISLPDGVGEAVAGAPTMGFIGAGNYASRILIPVFKETGAVLQSVASSGGVSGVHVGNKFGFKETTTDTPGLLADPRVNTIVITTQHNSHARFVCDALRAGKHVFVEKPLALTLDELQEIEEVYSSLIEELSSVPLLMVGFNRRFSPLIRKVKDLLAGDRGPKAFVMMVNAGGVAEDHWTQDKSVGGGRIIGEGCHFIDLLRFLAGDKITGSHLVRMEKGVGDTVTIQLSFADGSIGTVHYFANGSKKFPKERLEVFASGRILQLDNFRRLKGFGWSGFKKMSLMRQDKGQKNCTAAFIEAIKNGTSSPISFAELMEVSRVTVELSNS